MDCGLVWRVGLDYHSSLVYMEVWYDEGGKDGCVLASLV